MNSKYVLQVWTTLPSPPPNTHTHPVLQKEKKKKTGKERWPVNYEHIS